MRDDNGWSEMPVVVKAAVCILYLQTVLYTAAGILLLSDSAAKFPESGRTVPTSAYVLAVLFGIAAVVLLVCAVLLVGKESTARPVVAGVEALGMGGMLFAVQDISRILGPALACLVLYLLARPESTEWLKPRSDQQDAVRVAD